MQSISEILPQSGINVHDAKYYVNKARLLAPVSPKLVYFSILFILELACTIAVLPILAINNMLK